MNVARGEGGAPLVTVLTAARNAGPYLAEAVESILAQTFSDWEYVIVDDASEDDTPSIVERYAKADPRFRLIRRRERGGPYVAANDGFRQARGRYVARLDADDISLPHRLERQLEFMSANPGLRACAANVMLLVDGEARELDIGELPVLPGSLKWRLVVRWGFMPSTTLIERAAFEEVGGFTELPLSQDHRLWCDLSRRRWLGVVPEVLAYWRVHDEQLSVRQQPLQESLAMDVIRDHLSELSPETWSKEDVQRLRSAGVWPVPLLAGLRLIARFNGLWQADETLSEEERDELTRLTRRIRTEHVQVWLRHKRLLIGDRLGSVGWGRPLLRLYRALKPPQRPYR